MSSSLGAAGQRLHLRLFLEGIEVPVVAAQVQVNINSPATASIQVVPSDRVFEFKPRTMVHLFYWDSNTDLAPAPNTGAPQTTPPDNNLDLSLYAEDDDIYKRYKLLFSGEVVGLFMQKTPTTRQVALQCADFSTYWDTTYQLFLSYGPSGNFLFEQSAVWGADSGMFDNILSGHSAVLGKYLHSTPKTPGLQNVKGLMGGVISLLEAMGGVPRHTHGVNDFFTVAEMKNHILQQICIEQNDDTPIRLFANQAFWEFIMRGATSMGELVTFRDMMRLLFNYIYYENVPCPAAMYVPATASTTATKSVRSDMADDVRSELSAMSAKCKEWAGKPTDDVQTNANRLTLSWDWWKSLTALATSSRAPAGVRGYLRKAAQNLMAMRNTKVQMVDPVQTTYLWKDTSAQLDRALKMGPTYGSKEVVVPGELDMLHTQIFRPDCFFAPPPKCNVIFPEQYVSFSYSRQYLQEITRLRLSTGWFGNPSGNGILGIHHFSPSTAQITALAAKQGNSWIRALLPWEKFSGIVPKFEHINEVKYISSKKDREMRPKAGKKKVVGAAMGYAQRTANFNYIKYRMAARTAEVVCRFSPQIVAGWPALIIERPFIVEPSVLDQAYKSDEVQAMLKMINRSDYFTRFHSLVERLKSAPFNQKTPTQFLGMIAMLAHSVDQKGGYTNLSLTHARAHRINDDDFLNLYMQQINSTKIKVLKSTELDLQTLINKGDYAKVRMLIEATPQDIPQQMQQTKQENLSARSESTSESVALTARPNGAPNLPNEISSGAAFQLLELPVLVAGAADAALSTPPPPPQVVGDWSWTTYLGRTKQQALKGTRVMINVPEGTYLLKKGPNKGAISAVQVVTNAVRKLVYNEFSDMSAKAKTIVFGKTPQELYAWERAIIWEETENSATITRPLPVEESMRPGWFSPLYSGLLIGNNIYQPFFGCGSVVDESVFAANSSIGVAGGSVADHETFMTALEQADGNPDKIRDLIQEAKVKDIADIPSIEDAADMLAYVYGEVKRLDLDVHRFVADYTQRPIATMYDMFGSEDLAYKMVSQPAPEGGKAPRPKLTLYRGVQGFHSTAILAPPQNEQLLGLLENPELELPRLIFKSGKKYPVALELDPRKERRAAVLAYTDELGASPGAGVLGVGVRG